MKAAEMVPAKKRAPYSVRDAVNLLVDVEIFGVAWVDWSGRRVDPRLVYTGYNGSAYARGKRVYKPTSVTLDFDERPAE